MNETRAHAEDLLRTLKLRAVLAMYEEITEKAATHNLQYEEYLVALLEEEVKRRQEASIKAKVSKAKFPFIKTMEEFDFSFQPGLKERKVINLDRKSVV
jgi:DNA replication protein DnaC